MTNFIKKISVPQIIVGAYASLILIGAILSAFRQKTPTSRNVKGVAQ